MTPDKLPNQPNNRAKKFTLDNNMTNVTDVVTTNNGINNHEQKLNLHNVNNKNDTMNNKITRNLDSNKNEYDPQCLAAKTPKLNGSKARQKLIRR